MLAWRSGLRRAAGGGRRPRMWCPAVGALAARPRLAGRERPRLPLSGAVGGWAAEMSGRSSPRRPGAGA